MRIIFSLLIGLTLLLSACGSSRGTGSQPVPVSESTNPLIPEATGIFSGSRNEVAAYPGTPINTVSRVAVEPIPGGAIIRAEGIAAVRGVFDIRLIPVNPTETAEDGVLTYRLEGIRPLDARPSGPQSTRAVIAARQVTDQTLQGVRTIRVEGAQNAQTSRR